MTSTPGELGTAADTLRKLAKHATATAPAVTLALADWLGCLAMLDPSEHGGNECGWCGGNHALAVARTVNGTAP